MKTSKKINTVFAIMFVLCLLCGIVQFFNGTMFHGATHFVTSTVLYSIVVALTAVYIILYFLLFRKFKLSLSFTVFLVMLILQMPSMIYSSLDYYKDLFEGKTVVETELYGISSESYHNVNLEEPIYIYTDDKYYNLIIDEDTYFDLVRNNPLDKSRLAYVKCMGWKTYPHEHYIRAEFYEHTEIIDNIEILYD